LAKKNGIKEIIIDDSSLGMYKTKRQNYLYNFFDFSILDIKIIFKSVYLTKLRIPKVFAPKFSRSVFVSDRNFQEVLRNANKTFLLLDGYFQQCLSQEDFNEEIELLMKIFVNKNLEKIENGFIIHIRGGDFLKLGWNLVNSEDYYKSAIRFMRKKFSQDKFFVVSDDRRYCESLLEKLHIEYDYIGGDISDDFYLIGSFKYRILSSSTFALWGSALGYNIDSVVIAPKNWRPYRIRNIKIPNEI